MKSFIIQIYVDSAWKDCCLIEVSEPKKSRFSPSSFDFCMDYFVEHAAKEGTVGVYSPSLRLELDLVRRRFGHWPSFLLDIMPQGAARKVVCQRERIVDSEENDLQILLQGAVNPVGNIRVKSDLRLFSGTSHPGFLKQDLLEKNEDFLEHAEKYKAIVIGTSGAQGVAPKFLLNTDANGKWHCDGALKDDEVVESYLVKLPRGKSRDDRLILKAEKTYMDLAAIAGANANKGIWHEDNMLFIPRFDREKSGGRLLRHGMESISSAAGHYEFGKTEKVETYLNAIAKFSSAPKEDLIEFVRRDFLSIVMGNTDNHGRNSAFLKKESGETRLSPLFDFAPMVMDPEMIPRTTKWLKEKSYIPDFAHVEESLLGHGIERAEAFLFFKTFLNFLDALPSLLVEKGLEREVVERAFRKLPEFSQKLKEHMERA